MNELTNILRQKITKYDCYITGYGHIGDTNLHINVALKNKNDAGEIEKILEPYIFEYLRNVKGSISAEHGLGVMKSNYLNY